MKYVLALVLAAFVGVGCVTERYSEPPDETWKPRDSYCWAFQVDPTGQDNNNLGWSDEQPTIRQTIDGSSILEARNARVHTGLRSGKRHGEEKEDSFRQYILWTAGRDGYVNIEKRC